MGDSLKEAQHIAMIERALAIYDPEFGVQVLNHLRLIIDYRNGTVRFEH